MHFLVLQKRDGFSIERRAKNICDATVCTRHLPHRTNTSAWGLWATGSKNELRKNQQVGIETVPTAALSIVHRWAKIKRLLIILVYTCSTTKIVERVESSQLLFATQDS